MKTFFSSLIPSPQINPIYRHPLRMKKGDLGSSEVNVAKVPANSENRLLRTVQLHIAEPNVIEESMLREGIVSADYVPISSDRIKAM